MPVTETTTAAVDGYSLAGYLVVLRERRWWIIGTVVLCVGLALGWSLLMVTPTYRATSRLLRQTTSFDRALFDTQLYDLRDAQRALETGSNLIKLGTVATMVQDELETSRTPEQLVAMVSVQPQINTEILDVSGTSTDPAEAAAVANSFGRQFILYRQQADRKALAQARAQIDRQLAAMPAAERTSERANILAQKSEELAVLESMQTGGYEVVELAKTPQQPFAPKPVRSGVLAGVGGLIAGVLLAFVLDRLNQKLKTTDAVEREFGMPVLASTPHVRRGLAIKGNGARHRGPATYSDPSPAFVESFRTLRSNLKFFEIDQPIRTILITSALPGQGKTVTAANLAMSLALSGAHVVLIEGDLRRPALHGYLGISPNVGVSNVLAGTHALATAAQLVEVVERTPLPTDAALARGTLPHPRSDLLCVPSGPLPPNPAELIGSQRMQRLIEEASGLADYVLIDSPPLLVVADALNIVERVDAVILCAKVGSATIEDAHRVRRLLERTRSKAIGVVATNVKMPKSQHYDVYGYTVHEKHNGKTGTAAKDLTAAAKP